MFERRKGAVLDERGNSLSDSAIIDAVGQVVGRAGEGDRSLEPERKKDGLRAGAAPGINACDCFALVFSFLELPHEIPETHRFNERRKIRSFPSSDEGASGMVKFDRFGCCGGSNWNPTLRGGKGRRVKI